MESALLLSSCACLHDGDRCCCVGGQHFSCKWQRHVEGSGVENAGFLLDVDENGLNEPVLSLQLCFPLPMFNHHKNMLSSFSSL